MLAPLILLAMGSKDPEIDLYTMGQGSHVFERFGHAAICVVYDAEPQASLCYNYGTTDFGSPPEELGWAFLRGEARFWVSVWPLGRMIRAYQASDRTIWRQRLELPLDQRRRIVEKLEHDAREENRYYLYHHFHDNCSTRVRDVIELATDGRLGANADRRFGPSFRQLGRQGLAEFRIALLLGDLLVGRDADRHPSLWQAMFLPDVLRGEAHAAFGSVPELVFERRGPPFAQTPPSNTPSQLAFALALASPPALARLTSRSERIARGISGGVLGLVGVVVWLVAIVTHVPELRQNEMALVFWPTDALLGLLRDRWLLRYARLRLSVLAVLSALAAAGVLQQPLLMWVLAAALPMLLSALPRQAERASSTTAATA
jgi:hypothetical protein